MAKALKWFISIRRHSRNSGCLLNGFLSVERKLNLESKGYGSFELVKEGEALLGKGSFSFCTELRLQP